MTQTMLYANQSMLFHLKLTCLNKNLLSSVGIKFTMTLRFIREHNKF